MDAVEEVKELIRLQRGKEDVPLVFTHGDLSSFNVMVKKRKVTGIIDWETAGWAPEYWEYTVARDAAVANDSEDVRCTGSCRRRRWRGSWRR